MGAALEAAAGADGTGLYLPAQNLNTLAQLMPGKAYFVKVAADTVLDFALYNHPPVAEDDFAVANEVGGVYIPVLANDHDPDGGLLPATVTNSGLPAPAHGSITIFPGNGKILYVPENGYVGTDQFAYRVFMEKYFVLDRCSLRKANGPNWPLWR